MACRTSRRSSSSVRSLIIVLLLFGSSQLPKLARSLGQAQKEFKSGMDEGAKEEPEGSKVDKQD